MDDELFLAGKKYVSSKRAADLTGYAKDYIGQMCRAKKLDAKLIGRNWYVDLEMLEKTRKRAKMLGKTLAEAEKESRAATVARKSHPNTTHLLDIIDQVSFYRDETPLIPSTQKKEDPIEAKISIKTSAEPRVTILNDEPVPATASGFLSSEKKFPQSMSGGSNVATDSPTSVVGVLVKLFLPAASLAVVFIAVFYAFTGTELIYSEATGLSRGVAITEGVASVILGL